MRRGMPDGLIAVDSQNGQSVKISGGDVGTTMMYYPFVDPPRPVLWQALLYWDKSSPASLPLTGNQYQFGPELTGLQDVGFYRPTHADDLPLRHLHTW